ncbi:MAG TPA: hypothetical protein VFX58_10725 [Chitinophagaceae bacterium]|nr:hypothetical protein [Chitinophagaceae bacterium]
MRLHPVVKLTALLLAVLPVCFSACVKDKCKEIHTYSYFVPVYKTRDEVRANIKSNPAQEVRNPGKLYIRGNYIFLNDVDRGIHVIDNSNPSQPRNMAFIDIPGNMDLAVKGNTLYADLYTDLVTIDISNPLSITVKKFIDNIFPNRYYGGGFVGINTGIITDWVRKDTTITGSCDQGWLMAMDGRVFSLANASGSGGPRSVASSPIGQGGSMARFAIMNERLYTVSTSHLDVFNISTPTDPVKTNNVGIGWDIETIYPFNNKLFIGSMSGMFIYDVSNPDAPVQAGQFSHVRTCDPVIADNDYAYVTLRSGTPCQGFTNQLNILQLNNLSNPQLLKVYNMKNPHGLSKDGNYLFICDASDGLKIYNAADVHNLQLLKQITGIDTYDVIAWAGIALVVAKDGLYQYDYTSMDNIRLLSKIVINKN